MTQSIANKMIKSAKAAVVAALALVFWAFGSVDAFFVRAQDKGTEVYVSVQRVYFRLDNSVLTPSYMGNAATLETIDSLATVCASNGVSGLVITSFSSLEGNFNYNAKLSERRANALRDYIVDLHPLLRNRVSTNVHAESWEDLRAAVLADSRFSDSERDEIVSVIDSGDEPDSREARLKTLPSYNRLYALYFKSLRYAEIRFAEDFAAASAAAATTAGTATAASGSAAATAADNAAAGNKAVTADLLFPEGSTSVEPDYADNPAALAAIANLLEGRNPEDFESIVVYSGSSIDGSVASNDRASRKRGESLVKWIEENYPQYKGHVELRSAGEDWDVLRSAVESDTNLSRIERNSILSIIDSNDTPENKEARLKSISSWDYVKENLLPLTRHAGVSCTAAKSTAAADSTATVAAAAAADSAVAADSISAPADSSYAHADATSGEATADTASVASETTANAASATASADTAATSADASNAAPVATAAPAASDAASTAAAAAAAAAAPRSAVASGVHFPLSGTSVEPDHAANSAALAKIAKLLESNNPEDVDSVVVISGCSIDGTVAHNSRVSRERGNALVNWIAENYPEYKSKLVLDSRGEDWDAMREAVAADSNLSDEQKASVLEVIDSNDGAERKEARLRELDSWPYVQENILPQTRYAYARIARVSILKPEESPILIHPELTVELEDSTDTMLQPHDTLVVADSLMQVDTIAYVREVPADEQPAAADTVIRERTPLFALTTNLLYTSATVFTGFHSVPLTIGVEVPVGQHWSVYSNYMATAPWRAWDNNAECAELIHLDLGAKWYPGGTFYKPFVQNPNREVLDGWYAYGAVGAGYYDFERDGKGYQGEEILGTLGLGYGLNLGKNWSLDFAVGVGPMFTQYRYYIARNNNQYLAYQYSGTMQYFGVTDAKVTLRYMLHYNKKVKSQNK